MAVMKVDPSAEPSQPRYEVTTQRDVVFRMRDGVELACDIYRPCLNGVVIEEPMPVLLQRTPYNKLEIDEDNDCQYFAERGYVTVLQDCRGCFASGGDVNFLIPEAQDGFDTIECIAAEPWCNGRVGMWGTSWAGWTQTAAAALGPKNLVTMIPNMSGANAHESSVRQGGAMELRFIAWAFWHSAYNTQRRLNADLGALNFGAPRFSDWLKRMPIRKGMTQLALVPAYERWVFDLLTRSDYDDYWMHPSLNPRAYYECFPDIPVLWVGGWYDSYARASLEHFRDLSHKLTAPQHLIMGPWVHGSDTMESSIAGDVDFGGAAALPSFQALELRWFDRWMRGVDNGLEVQSKLDYFVMGGGGGARSPDGCLSHGGRWRQTQTWPLPEATTESFYLCEGGLLSTTAPDTGESSTTYRFDPNNPVPSCGGSVSSLSDLAPLRPGINDPTHAVFKERFTEILEAGAFDQVEREDLFGCTPPYLPIGSRMDVLVFQTTPFRERCEVTGPVSVDLFVSSSAIDTDFTAKLIDVYPPSRWNPYGYAMNLTDGIQRLRYREGPDTEVFVEPGQIVAVTITLYPTSNVFDVGHRIRVDISSSNYPRFDVNPNTGEPLGQNRRTLVADNTIYHCRKYASKVTLAVVERKR